MKLIYTGDFGRLKEFGFEYDSNLSDNFELLFRTHKLNIVKKISSGMSPVSNFLHHQLSLSAYPFISGYKMITQKSLFT